jgi:hypothetical protein
MRRAIHKEARTKKIQLPTSALSSFGEEGKIILRDDFLAQVPAHQPRSGFLYAFSVFEFVRIHGVSLH